MSTSVQIQNVRKLYGDTVAIPDLTLEIEPGEFFTLLGPSGCGKTTLLRMIAGFNSIEGGRICFDDSPVNDVPPGKRNIGMVFQDYALFPHMTAGKNVEFGLETRMASKAGRGTKVAESLGVVQMTDYAERLPGKMSGGQQQRVALARALAIEPSILLMDEPLSNLDAKLRTEMRDTIRAIQEGSGITTIYVTHDQEEAMAVSDRIAVMADGEVQQVGRPWSIYHEPANTFVAEFIGKSNWLTRKPGLSAEGATVSLSDDYGFTLSEGLPAAVTDGGEVMLSIRPEAVSIAESGCQAKVVSSMFLGALSMSTVELPGGETLETTAVSKDGATPMSGDTVHLRIDPNGVRAFDVESGVSLRREAVSDVVG